MTDQYTIEFMNEKCIGIESGQTILEASLQSGIPHFHICGGQAKCSTCRVLVVKGAGQMTLRTDKEQNLARKLQLPDNVRLACQTRILGSNAKVERIIKDQEDMALYIKSGQEASAQTGEEREMILFFLDIRGFTKLVASCLPFDSIHIIRKIFSSFDSMIREGGGEIIETMGDGFYAVFCNREDKKTAIQSAVRSAKYILEKLKNLDQQYFEKYFNENIRIGIGIHIGKVIIGDVFIHSSRRKIIMGFPVNIASRLQDATKTLNNDLVVSAELFHQLPVKPANYSSELVSLPGIKGRHEVYLLGEKYH